MTLLSVMPRHAQPSLGFGGVPPTDSSSWRPGFEIQRRARSGRDEGHNCPQRHLQVAFYLCAFVLLLNPFGASRCNANNIDRATRTGRQFCLIIDQSLKKELVCHRSVFRMRFVVGQDTAFRQDHSPIGICETVLRFYFDRSIKMHDECSSCDKWLLPVETDEPDGYERIGFPVVANLGWVRLDMPFPIVL